MLLHKILYFPETEFAKPGDLGAFPIIRRDDPKSFFLIFDFHYKPCFMLTVKATPVGIGQKMRP
jgi:hypothetical protein